MADGLSGLLNGMKEITSTANTVSQTVGSVNRVVKAGNNLMGTTLGGGNASPMPKAAGNPVTAGAGLAAPAAPGVTVPAATPGLTAPNGTCIILPSDISQTGQPRYLGKNAYQSLMNIMSQNPDGVCSDVVILDANNLPSALVYDQTADGKLLLKGTQIPVDIKKADDGTYAAVPLSEKEFASVQEGMKTQGPGKFNVSDKGEAEDADSRSWFERNWAAIVSSFAVICGALGAWLMIRKYKKSQKNAKNTTAALSSQVSSLEKQIDEAKKTTGGNEPGHATQPVQDSTLSANATLVKVTDTPIISANNGKEY